MPKRKKHVVWFLGVDAHQDIKMRSLREVGWRGLHINGTLIMRRGHASEIGVCEILDDSVRGIDADSRW